MAKPQNILVSIDGSDNALRALKFSLSLVQPGGRIHLLYVQVPVARSWVLSEELIEEHYRRQEEAALKKVRGYLKRAKGRIAIQVCIGEPAPTIVEYARKKRCTQIVMGNRGHGAIAGMFLGSVAMKVVQLSQIPVTLVK